MLSIECLTFSSLLIANLAGALSDVATEPPRDFCVFSCGAFSLARNECLRFSVDEPLGTISQFDHTEFAAVGRGPKKVQKELGSQP